MILFPIVVWGETVVSISKFNKLYSEIIIRDFVVGGDGEEGL